MDDAAGGAARFVVESHEVVLLRNGRELFPAMLGAIDRARRTIILEMYWVEDDAVGRAFRDALVSAAERGVDVRVIVDGFGSSALPSGWFGPLRAAHGRAMIFHPLLASLEPRKSHRLLARDHRKVLVVDGMDAFVGGVNLCAKWLPIADGGEGWRDTAMHVRGADVALHLARLFDATWARVTRSRVAADPPMAWSLAGGAVGVLANTPQQRRGRKIRQAYLRGLRRAHTSVDITCAYFAPRRLFAKALVSAVRRGVRVRILLPFESDVWVADLLAAPWIRALAGAGIEIYGYVGAILHAKTAVFDARWVTVGSHNLDALSWAYNLECNVFVDDEAVGRAAEAMFEDDLRLAIRLPLPGVAGPAEALSRALGRAMSWIYALRR
jgi:cardiolipin synthase A/B